MSDFPPIGSLWRHRKGGLYVVTGHCRVEATNTDAVLYTGVGGGGAVWARPVDEFIDGRFTDVHPLHCGPDALSTAREEGRREGLEEAAKVADDEDGRFTWAGQDSNVRLLQQCASEIAAVIRALKEKQR